MTSGGVVFIALEDLVLCGRYQYLFTPQRSRIFPLCYVCPFEGGLIPRPRDFSVLFEVNLINRLPPPAPSPLSAFSPLSGSSTLLYGVGNLKPTTQGCVRDHPISGKYRVQIRKPPQTPNGILESHHIKKSV